VTALYYQALYHHVYKLVCHVGFRFFSSTLYGLIRGAALRFPSTAASIRDNFNKILKNLKVRKVDKYTLDYK